MAFLVLEDEGGLMDVVLALEMVAASGEALRRRGRELSIQARRGDRAAARRG